MQIVADLVAQGEHLIALWQLHQIGMIDTGNRGSGAAIFGGEHVRVRFVSDQGRPSIDIASMHDPDDWFDLALLFNLHHGRPLDALPTIAEQIAFATSRHDQLLAELTTGFTKARLRWRDAEGARFAAMFGCAADLGQAQ